MYQINGHAHFSEAFPNQFETVDHYFIPHHYDLPCGDVYLVTAAGDIMFIGVDTEESVCCWNSTKNGLFPCYYRPVHKYYGGGVDEYVRCKEDMEYPEWAFSDDCLMVLMSELGGINGTMCVVFRHGNILYKGECDPRGVLYQPSYGGSNMYASNIPTVHQEYQWRKAKKLEDGTLVDDPEGQYCGNGTCKSRTWEWVTLRSSYTSEYNVTETYCDNWKQNNATIRNLGGLTAWHMYMCAAGSACGSCPSESIPSDKGEFTNHAKVNSFSTASCTLGFGDETCYCKDSRDTVRFGMIDNGTMQYQAQLINLAGGFALIPIKQPIPKFADFTYIGNIDDPSELPGVKSGLNDIDEEAIKLYEVHYRDLRTGEIVNPDPATNKSTVTRIGIQYNDVFRYGNSYYKYTYNGWKLYQGRWKEDWEYRWFGKYLLIHKDDSGIDDLTDSTINEDGIVTCRKPKSSRIITGINIARCSAEWVVVNDQGDTSTGRKGRYFLLNLKEGESYEGEGNASIQCANCFAIVTAQQDDGKHILLFGRKCSSGPMYEIVNEEVKIGSPFNMHVSNSHVWKEDKDLPNQYLILRNYVGTNCTESIFCCDQLVVSYSFVSKSRPWLSTTNTAWYIHSLTQKYYGTYKADGTAIVIEGCEVIYEGKGYFGLYWGFRNWNVDTIITAKFTGVIDKVLKPLQYSYPDPGTTNHRLHCTALVNKYGGVGWNGDNITTNLCLEEAQGKIHDEEYGWIPESFHSASCEDLSVIQHCGNNAQGGGSAWLKYLVIDLPTGNAYELPLVQVTGKWDTCGPDDCCMDKLDALIDEKVVAIANSNEIQKIMARSLPHAPVIVNRTNMTNKNELGHLQQMIAVVFPSYKEISRIYCTDSGSTVNFYLHDLVNMNITPVLLDEIAPFGWNNHYEQSPSNYSGKKCDGTLVVPMSNEFYGRPLDHCNVSKELGKTTMPYYKRTINPFYIQRCDNKALLDPDVEAVVQVGWTSLLLTSIPKPWSYQFSPEDFFGAVPWDSPKMIGKNGKPPCEYNYYELTKTVPNGKYPLTYTKYSRWTSNKHITMVILPRYFAIMKDGKVIPDNTGGHPYIKAYKFPTFVMENASDACELVTDPELIHCGVSEYPFNNETPCPKPIVTCNALIEALKEFEIPLQSQCNNDPSCTNLINRAIPELKCSTPLPCPYYVDGTTSNPLGTFVSYNSVKIKTWTTRTYTGKWIACCQSEPNANTPNGINAGIFDYTTNKTTNTHEATLFINGKERAAVIYNATVSTLIATIQGCRCGFTYLALGVQDIATGEITYTVEPHWYTDTLTSITSALNIDADLENEITFSCCKGYGWAYTSASPKPMITNVPSNTNPLFTFDSNGNHKPNVTITDDNLEEYLGNPNCTHATFDDGTQAVGKWAWYLVRDCDGTSSNLLAWVDTWHFRGIDGVYKSVQNYYRPVDNPLAASQTVNHWVPFMWTMPKRQGAIYKLSKEGLFAGLITNDDGLVSTRCNFYNTKDGIYEGLDGRTQNGDLEHSVSISMTWPPTSEMPCEPGTVIQYKVLNVRKVINNPYNAPAIKSVQSDPFMRYEVLQRKRSDHVGEKGLLTNTQYLGGIEILDKDVKTGRHSDFDKLEQKSRHDTEVNPSGQGNYYTIVNDRDAIKPADQLKGTGESYTTNKLVQDLKIPIPYPEYDQVRSVFSENNTLWILDKELGVLKYDLWGKLLT